MNFPGYNTGNVILTEGDWFPFRVHKLVRMQDDAWYYILEDINKMKHFIPAVHYSNYGIRSGDEIPCKIDKINCTGRIHLEPKHPYYNEGEIYVFNLIVISKKNNKSIIQVEDIFNNLIEISNLANINLAQNVQNSVKCRIVRIVKAVPILELSSDYF